MDMQKYIDKFNDKNEYLKIKKAYFISLDTITETIDWIAKNKEDWFLIRSRIHTGDIEECAIWYESELIKLRNVINSLSLEED